jgi:integrase
MPIPKAADPIRDRRHIKAIKATLQSDEKPLQLLLFTLAINSGLRVGDILGLTVGHLWDVNGSPLPSFTVTMQKTEKPVRIEINDSIQHAMRLVEPTINRYESEAVLFPITRQTVTRWVKSWCHNAGADNGNFSAHSLRKTYAFHLWDAQGRTDEGLVYVSKSLGHKSTGMTLDYLGVNRSEIAKLQRKLNL